MRGAALWLTVMALLASNAIRHIVGAVRTWSYSPGMVTGTVLYLPLAVNGHVHFTRSGAASIGIALLAAIVGASYHLAIAPAMHRWRSRVAKA